VSVSVDREQRERVGATMAEDDVVRAHFTKLFKHLAWADQKALQSLRGANTLLRTIMDLYSHVLGAEHVWLSRLKGEPARIPVWPTMTLDEAATLAAENAAEFDKLIATVRTDAIQRPITYRNSAGDQFTSSLEDILTHVAMHGSYHRGQIASALRASGEVPAPTDYIAFVRGAPAARRQP
jgi:uncharacterized damage-inducible protein DinB